MMKILVSPSFSLFLSLLLSSALAEEFVSDSEIFVDLTHPFDSETIYWPTEPGFSLDVESAGVTDKGYFYASNRFATAEHGGTHIDAPIHFYADRETVDQIPLGRLIGPAVCVDVSHRCAADRDYLISVEDLQKWESQTDKSLEKKIVLLRTGYGQYWPNREKYLGTAATGREAVSLLHFPGLDPVAAEWLVSKRNIRAVGIDTASIDPGQSDTFGSHINLCRANIPALENVANLDQLPEHGFTILALPMKIAGGSGAPCRIVAIMRGQ
mgnify:CR=1 FL=1